MGIHLCYNWGKLIVLAKVFEETVLVFQTFTEDILKGHLHHALPYILMGSRGVVGQ